jgi:hypothetical protein
MRLKVLLSAAMLAGAVCANLSAAPISGSFDLAGNVVVSSSGGIVTVAFNQLVTSTPNKANVGNTVSGDFLGLQGTTVSIANLNSGTEPAGPPFAAVPFISFDAAPVGFPTLLINQVFPGVFSNAQCGAAPAPGQTCTVDPTSPFNLTNTPGSGGTINSTAIFNVAGVTSDGQSSWTGLFSANFNVPYQSVLQTFSQNGSVSNTYSGTFIVTTTPIPEAGTLSLLGLGLVAMSMKLRRRS